MLHSCRVPEPGITAWRLHVHFNGFSLTFVLFFSLSPNPPRAFGKYHVHLQSLRWHAVIISPVSPPHFSVFCPLRVALEAPRYKRSLTNQTVNVTESLRMECDVEGRPLPRLYWFKDSQPLHQMSGAWVHLHRWCMRLHNSSNTPTQPDPAATWTLSHTHTHTHTHSTTVTHEVSHLGALI